MARATGSALGWTGNDPNGSKVPRSLPARATSGRFPSPPVGDDPEHLGDFLGGLGQGELHQLLRTYPGLRGLGGWPCLKGNSSAECMELDGEVAVCVVHDTDVRQPRSGRAYLLPPLAPSGRARALARFELAAGKFVEAPQQPGRSSLLDEVASSRLDHDDGGHHVGSGRASAPPRQRPRVVQNRVRPTVLLYRAAGAIGVGRKADRLPELHQSFVEPSGVPAREDSLEILHESLCHGCRTNVPPFGPPTSGHPPTVGLESDYREVERDRRDRACDVRADPRQGLQLVHGLREYPSSLGHDLPRGGVKVPRSGVVSRSLPDLQHRRERCAGERPNGREASEEPLVVGHRLSDPGLLEHHFGDPNRVRVVRASPR